MTAPQQQYVPPPAGSPALLRRDGVTPLPTSPASLPPPTCTVSFVSGFPLEPITDQVCQGGWEEVCSLGGVAGGAARRWLAKQLWQVRYPGSRAMQAALTRVPNPTWTVGRF